MNYGKLSPSLAVLVFEYENFRGEDFLLIQPSRPQAVSISENGMPQATVFIHCEENTIFEDLPGICVNSRKGKIRTAQVELKKIGELSAMPDVRHLSVSMRLKPLNDYEAIGTAISELKSNYPELMAKDLIIGIIDTGINAEQTVFSNRIQSIWDQELSGEGSDEFKYGRFFNEGEYKESADYEGCGTQTAKILSDYLMPEAKFVVVKTDFQTAHLADGIRYIFETAEKLGKPAVVILSLDGHFQKPDGTDDLSMFIAQETGADKFVISAKKINKIGKNHYFGTIEPNIYLPKRLKLRVSANDQFGSPQQFILCGSFEDSGDCEIIIMAPNGMASKSAKPGLNENPTRHSNYQTSEAFLTVPTVSSLNNGKKEFYIDLRPVSPKRLISGGIWQLTIKNPGKTAVNIEIVSWVPEKPKDIKFV